MMYRIVLGIILIPLLGVAQEKEREFAKSIERGEVIYEDFCMNCHMPNGEGVAGVYPPLAKSDYLVKNLEKSIYAVKFGLEGEVIVNGKTYNSVMAPLGLTDEEIADVMNYINTQWGNTTKKMLTAEEVARIKK
ncbi:cytochrome c [Flavobacteriaceae bacterium F08102]|nr:cytochrome c [Flavobacteriaceae bacterium F08102]